MKARIEACPSPKGTNTARMFLLKLPRGADPKGALDAAMRSMKRGDAGGDLGELHRKLEHIITSCLRDEQQSAALEMLTEAFGGQRYGEVDRDRYRSREDGEDQMEHERDGEEELRQFAQRHHLSDDAAEELSELWSMPREAARENGYGGRLHEADDRRRADDRTDAAYADDRRRRGRGQDRRRMAGDAAAESSFDAFFPGAARIGQAL